MILLIAPDTWNWYLGMYTYHNTCNVTAPLYHRTTDNINNINLRECRHGHVWFLCFFSRLCVSDPWSRGLGGLVFRCVRHNVFCPYMFCVVLFGEFQSHHYYLVGYDYLEFIGIAFSEFFLMSFGFPQNVLNPGYSWYAMVYLEKDQTNLSLSSIYHLETLPLRPFIIPLSSSFFLRTFRNFELPP